MKWSLRDSVLVRLAVANIANGKSVYGRVKLLRDRMPHRSWESIRGMVNRVRQQEGIMAVGKVKVRANVRAKTKKVPPSKRQKPSQRNLTVKDLRDINNHIRAVRDSTFNGIESLQGQVVGLIARIEELEDRAAPGSTSAQPVDGAVAEELPGSHQ